MASKRLGYLDGVEVTAKIAAGGSASPSALIERVGDQIVQVMGLEECRFDYGTGLDYPRLEPDGNVRWRNQSRGRNRPSTPLGYRQIRKLSWSSRVRDDSWGGSCCGRTRGLDVLGLSAWSRPPWRLKSAPSWVLPRPAFLRMKPIPPRR